ncbi:hypothetical protein VP01_77g1 [Puccinia sorghi]|uniref:Uncharacterized protein n=1 Tax=Puccinia sorghi TaxID=27349 RepID=A0A0L6UC08_9BASI|nr:hypothetical protein VP01_77g1 [Puccinia sorghi]
MNTSYLMQCTHILFALQINGAQINQFQRNYQKYNETIGKLFEGRLLEKPQLHSMVQEADKDSLTEDSSRKIHRDACPVPLNGPGVLPGWAKAIWSIQRDGFRIKKKKFTKLWGCQSEPEDYLWNVPATVPACGPCGRVKRTNVPTARLHYYLHLYHAVVGQVMYEEAMVVSPSEIQCLATYWLLPSETFGITIIR